MAELSTKEVVKRCFCLGLDMTKYYPYGNITYGINNKIMTEHFSDYDLPKSKEPTPLGKIVGYDAEENAHSREALEIDYFRIDDDPQLLPAFHDLMGYIQEFQNQYSIPGTDIDPGLIRALTAENMSYIAGLLRLEKDNGGVYDTRTGVVYVREPERRDSDTSLAHFFYALSHELGHKLTSGLSHYYNSSDSSHILIEGLADRFARGYMHEVYLPKYAPAITETLTSQFAQGQRPFIFEGVELEREDILTIDPKTLIAEGFSRIFETKVVQALEAQLGDEVFSEVMRAAAGSDALAYAD
ncbi:hypothetical protein IPG36_02810 [bacterium]|nr:MAG: hypothetical protein IPG36_02810 [bacterium]